MKKCVANNGHSITGATNMNYKKNDDMSNKKNDKEKNAVAFDVNLIVMWVKRLLFCPDYKFNFIDAELISRECKICGKKEYPRYTAEGHIVW